MDDSEEKRKQEAYTHFAKIAINNSKAYEGSEYSLKPVILWYI